MNKILNKVDTDKSGYIDYSEFILATVDRDKLLTTDRLKCAFDEFDADKNGKITADELANILKK